ncbi:MAG: hypothetical protein P8H25_06670 [Flavobacteriaceae bacterium]|nr:hypothetical protein [Flavobacteriaceae bacterium]
MSKMIGAFLLLVSVFTLGVFMHQRNASRKVVLTEISWDDKRPRLIAQDSVNKLLTLVLSDSASAFKSGLNLRNIEQMLNHNAWVEDAQSFVYIDGSVGVHLTTKEPVVRVEGKESFYLDANGNPFPLSDHQSVMVPLFYGNPTADQRSLLVDAVQQTNQDFFMSKHIVAYEWLADGLALEPRIHDYQIIVGSTENLDEKIKNYKVFYAKMQDSAVLKTYKKVNLSFHGQVVCSK